MTPESKKLLSQYTCALSNETIYGEGDHASLKRCREYAAKTQAAREALEAHIEKLESVAELASPASTPEASQQAAAVAAPSDLLSELRKTADRAYCQYIEQLMRDVCKGVEYKLTNGKFGKVELEAHNKAAGFLAVHKALHQFAESYRIPTAVAATTSEDARDADPDRCNGNGCETGCVSCMPHDAQQLAKLILADPEGGYMRISSPLEYCDDGAMRFTVTNPDTGRRFGVHLGLAELEADTLRATQQEGGK